MMVLGAVYSRALTKQPAMMLFGYLVNMCLPAYLQGVFAKEITNDKDKGNFERYLEVSQLEMEQEPINSVKRGMKFLIGESLPKDNQECKFNNTYCAIAVDVSPRITTWHRFILDISCVFPENMNTTSQRYLSFYSLLGAIATLAGSVEFHKNGKDSDQADIITENKKAVWKILRQYGSEDNLGFGKESGSPVRETASQDGDGDGDVFCELFARWCWKIPEEKTTLPLLALTESWSRFLSVTTHLKEKYSTNLGENGKCPGNFLQDCIIYFLSNLLEYERVIMGIEGNTPGNHEGIESKFASSVESYFEQQKQNGEKKCHIFEYIFSCPIWMHFIDMTDTKEPWNRISRCYDGRLKELLPSADLEKIRNFNIGDDKYDNLFDLMNKKKV
jgi:hypothetical protein